MKLRIGATTYNVSFEENPHSDTGVELDGQIRSTDATIRIRDNTCDQFQDQVIMHEVVHGFCYQYGIKQLDERDTDVMATAIIMFMHDNPEFIKKILKDRGGKKIKNGRQAQGLKKAK